MIKPQNLNRGDKIAIVSLSKGLLGKESCKHELDIAIRRLKEFGLEPVIMPNAMKDMKYLEEHPELTTKKERKNIPWEELIYEDRETLGPRKLRSFLFPWKDDQNLE